MYLIPIGDLPLDRAYLRPTATRNGQSKRIRFAADYEIARMTCALNSMRGPKRETDCHLIRPRGSRRESLDTIAAWPTACQPGSSASRGRRRGRGDRARRDVDGSWWLFLALALAPDLSMLGHLAGPVVGAIADDLVHRALPVASPRSVCSRTPSRRCRSASCGSRTSGSTVCSGTG